MRCSVDLMVGLERTCDLVMDTREQACMAAKEYMSIWAVVAPRNGLRKIHGLTFACVYVRVCACVQACQSKHISMLSTRVQM